MDSTIELCLKRADNELILATVINRISQDARIKKDVFQISEDITFYNSVISHSYYAIFYSAKSYLISRKINFANKQGQHQKVYHGFKKLVKMGIIDSELLKIYDNVKVKAEELLGILEEEKKKRTEFTYERLPQANKEPAEQSLNNARHFISHMKSFIKNAETDKKETRK